MLQQQKKNTYTLGISCFYHDSSAALLKDGKIVAAVAEERLSRKKHDSSFPIKAITHCLQSQNITIKEIDAIGFYEKPILKFERLLSQHMEMFPSAMLIRIFRIMEKLQLFTMALLRTTKNFAKNLN